MSLLNSLEKVESTPLGNERLEELRKNDGPQLRVLLNKALNPAITFGIKKLPEPFTSEYVFDENGWYVQLLQLLDLLQSRELTGKAAQKAVAHFLGRCTDIQRKWTERIIKQDLRIGIGAKEVNNSLGSVIFQFSVPLATDYTKAKNFSGQWIVQPKLDGCRTVAYLYANGSVVLYSRTGQVWKNFESVRLKLEEINKNRSLHRGRDIVLDGEMVSYVYEKIDFQALQSTLFNKKGVEHGKLKYIIFDLAIREEWESQSKKPYAARFSEVNGFVTEAVEEVSGAVFRIGFVRGFFVSNPTTQNLVTHCNHYVSSGFEGAMMRRADSGIELKRTKSLLKIKTFQDSEAVVTGFVQGTGKLTNLMGALICETPEGKIFQIGSGFSDEQRKKFMTEKLVGRIVSYKYQELTDDKIPRFPIFKGFRSSDDVESLVIRMKSLAGDVPVDLDAPIVGDVDL